MAPAEARRYLGDEIADAVQFPGPVVKVEAHLPSDTFEAEGKVRQYHDGMLAQAEVRIRSERVLVTLIPALKAFFETREGRLMAVEPEPLADLAPQPRHRRRRRASRSTSASRRWRSSPSPAGGGGCRSSSRTRPATAAPPASPWCSAYYGKHLRLDDVRKVTGFGRDGADALAILSAARVFGLRGRGVKVDEVEDLKFLPPGSILHWQFNHFLVFERLTAEGAELVDPAGGRRRVGRDELGRSFTGVALTFEPGEDFEPQEGEPRKLGPLPQAAARAFGRSSSGSSSPRGWCSSSPSRCRC